MRRSAGALLFLLLSISVLAADDHTVLFDEDIDFSAFKTFSVTQPKVETARPELQFPPLINGLVEAIRASLTKRGLTEQPGSADLDVQTHVGTLGYAIGPFGRPSVVGPRSRGALPSETAYTEATVVVDLVRRSDTLLVWRGVFRDDEDQAGKLVTTLPADVSELLSQYPPRKREGLVR
jgi:hypothetical protein